MPKCVKKFISPSKAIKLNSPSSASLPPYDENKLWVLQATLPILTRMFLGGTVTYPHSSLSGRPLHESLLQSILHSIGSGSGTMGQHTALFALLHIPSLASLIYFCTWGLFLGRFFTNFSLSNQYWHETLVAQTCLAQNVPALQQRKSSKIQLKVRLQLRLLCNKNSTNFNFCHDEVLDNWWENV